jgi:geranylgeranyl reductase family protein
MDRCDVLVVGGGPAGSSCAWALGRAGLDVIVLDRATFPRDKTCAGWITPAVVELREIKLSDYSTGRVLQPITGFRVGQIGGRHTEIEYGRPVSYGIRRCEFDHYLLQCSGASLRLGESLRTLKRVGREWIANGSVASPMLVGAGGHFCPVARRLGADIGQSERAVAAQEIEFELDAAQSRACRTRAEVPELYFCKDLTGYGWSVRKGDYLNVGLGREDPQRLSDHVQRFAGWLQSCGRIPRDLPGRFRGHAYILYGHTRRKLVDDGVLLAGDSAGLAEPHTGEGIRTAIESGLFAAQTILAARGDYRIEALEPYSKRLTERFGDPDAGDGWLGYAPMWLKRAVAGPLFANPWFARNVVLDGWFLQGQGTSFDAERRTGLLKEAHVLGVHDE